jgi:putative acetyltransferase
MSSVRTRPETAADAAAIRRVHEQAFPTPAEAVLVDQLRTHGKATISWVAQHDGEVVGHILFSPVTVDGLSLSSPALGLAPVAVLPARQRQGVGASLVRDGLEACRHRGCGFVVVLGEPAYYRRFGFEKASRYGLHNDYGVDDEFQVRELQAGSIPLGGGLVRYASEFAGL